MSREYQQRSVAGIRWIGEDKAVGRLGGVSSSIRAGIRERQEATPCAVARRGMLLVMFRALLLGVMHGLSDHQLQFMLLDRTSFKEFAGLKSIDQVPDQKTLWKYRDQLSKSGCMDELFGMFKDQLWARGYELTSGQIVDSSIVSVAVQRNSREENTKIKGGEVPEDWEAKPNKLRQKDVAARWTRKGVKNYYGYKNHISADRQTKFIAHWCVTAASTHDSKMLMEVLSDDEQGDRQVWADSAYRSEVGHTGVDRVGLQAADQSQRQPQQVIECSSKAGKPSVFKSASESRACVWGDEQ